jgi:hypothetical protein
VDGGSGRPGCLLDAPEPADAPRDPATAVAEFPAVVVLVVDGVIDVYLDVLGNSHDPRQPAKSIPIPGRLRIRIGGAGGIFQFAGNRQQRGRTSRRSGIVRGRRGLGRRRPDRQ